jgi:hypothetical protein
MSKKNSKVQLNVRVPRQCRKNVFGECAGRDVVVFTALEHFFSVFSKDKRKAFYDASPIQKYGRKPHQSEDEAK